MSFLDLNLTALNEKLETKKLTKQKIALPIHIKTSHANATKLDFVMAKSGDLIIESYYSSYSPIKEAEKNLAECLANKSRTVVFWGFGLGIQLKPFLASKEIKKVFVIEPNMATFHTVLNELDLRDIINNDKVNFILDNNIDNIITYFKDSFKLIIDGMPYFYYLRKAIEDESDFYKDAIALLNSYLDALKSDVLTQAHFGKKWLKHIIYNLKSLDNKPLHHIEKAVVIGAGSSVNDNIEKIKNLKENGYTIIVCDALAMTMQNHNIGLDYIVNIDSSIFVNYHFIGIDKVNLIADLTAMPSLCKSQNTTFFSGSHPLCQMVGLNSISTKSGNVGTVAYLFAKSLGAKDIITFGLDFIYTQSSPYARGVYQYAYLQNKSSRLNPLLTGSFSLIFRYTQLNKSYNRAGFINYQPPLFKHYQKQFLKAKDENVDFWQAKTVNGIDFLKTYYKDLQELDLTNQDHSIKNKNLILTLMPTAASFYKENYDNPLLEAKNYALSLLCNVLKDVLHGEIIDN